MDEIVKMEHVYQYNEMMGQETLHPLVSVIDFSKCPKARHARRMYGFYCVFLKDVKCGDMRYGRHYYDYQEGTLVFIAPGQVVGIEDNGEVFQPKGWALLFHPDLIRGTSLGRSMDEYTFFSYEANEALHLSEQERLVVLECLQNITGELNHAIDKHSRRLIVSNIELLLNYSIRFYERQFITRSEVNKDALSRFERLLNDYFKGDTPQRDGVPSVRWCAEQLHLSANYFGDLIKKETGKSTSPRNGYSTRRSRSAKSPTNSVSAIPSTSPGCSRSASACRPTNTGRQTDAATKHYRIQAAATGATPEDRITRADEKPPLAMSGG